MTPSLRPQPFWRLYLEEHAEDLARRIGDELGPQVTSVTIEAGEGTITCRIGAKATGLAPLRALATRAADALAPLWDAEMAGDDPPSLTVQVNGYVARFGPADLARA